MSESAFEVHVRQVLHEAYYPHGVFWNNKTGYSYNGQVKNHDPFPARGAGDLIGCVMGLWVEVENKARVGKWGKLQKVRRELVVQCGGLYVVCHESNSIIGLATIVGAFDLAVTQTIAVVDSHIIDRLGSEWFDRVVELRRKKLLEK